MRGARPACARLTEDIKGMSQRLTHTCRGPPKGGRRRSKVGVPATCPAGAHGGSRSRRRRRKRQPHGPGRAGPRTSSRKCSWEEDGKTCFWSKTALEEPAVLILTCSPFASGTAGYKSPTFSEASWILFSLLGSSAVTPPSLHRLLS